MGCTLAPPEEYDRMIRARLRLQDKRTDRRTDGRTDVEVRTIARRDDDSQRRA